jgi:hypothetical protein
MYRCNPRHDLPEKWKAKRIIFYGQGLKIYGEMPYLLKRRLKAEFFSNFRHNGQFGLIAPAMEMNYSVVPYNQSPEYTAALLEWLFADAGFEWAIAMPDEFDLNIRRSTAFSDQLPHVWSPAQNEQGWNEGFAKAMTGIPPAAIQKLLGGDAGVG